MEKIKSLKLKLSASLFLLFCLIIFSVFFSGDFSNFAQALSSNYSKAMPTATLNVNEWNNLPNDFVAKSGDTMTGILDMGGKRITNLAAPVADTDAANKSYVDTELAAIGGSGAGSIYINWGRADCPDSSVPLYTGFGFNANSGSVGGSDNYLCINDSGTAGGAYSGSYADSMYPIVTGGASDLPSEIASGYLVRCAVCRKVGTCYESYGDWGCNTLAGFNNLYDGYVLGSGSTGGATGNSGQRACVNLNFDNSFLTPYSGVTLWTGSRIEDDFGLGYSTGAYIRCSICCN